MLYALSQSPKSIIFIVYLQGDIMKIVLNNGFAFSKKGLFLFIFLFTLIILFILTIALLARFRPVFEEKASTAAKMRATDIINKSADYVFKDINSVDLVNITSKENGEISSVVTNSIEINRLKTLLSLAIQKFTENVENSTIHIPVGSLTSYPVLQGIGYRIPVKIMTDGFSKIDFKSEFMQAGINQVKHKIYAEVTVNISVISTAMTKTETVTAEIPMTETVIVGTVPNYYGDSLNVVGR